MHWTYLFRAPGPTDQVNCVDEIIYNLTGSRIQVIGHTHSMFQTQAISMPLCKNMKELLTITTLGSKFQIYINWVVWGT